MLNARLYAPILVLLLAFVALGCFLYRKYVKDTVKLGDIEANTEGKEQKQCLHLLTPPDPVVHPFAARRSSQLLSSLPEHVISNPFQVRFGNEPLAVVKTGQPKVDDGEVNNHENSDQTSNIPIPPRRPLRPTLLDDLLAGFPHEHDVARDMWFPLANPVTGRLELGIVRGASPASRYAQRNGSDGQGGPETDERSVFSIDEDQVNNNTLLAPSNTIVETVAKKRKKRDGRRRKKRKKNSQPRVHVFEIPELYVNARPYEEIEAEEQARAAAAALAAEEAEVDVEEAPTVETTTGVAAATEEEEDSRCCRPH